ncbi:hypothetical protein AAFN90_04090 [Erwiniaceae bacterium CAU 1747]
MLKENKEIIMTGDEVVELVKIIDHLLISINNISHYYFNEKNTPESKILEVEQEIGHFFIKNNLGNSFIKARGVLLGKFDNTLGDDDMDDIERATESTQYWEKPGD